MRHQHPIQVSRERQHIRVAHTRRNDPVRQFEANGWLTSQQACDNTLIKIGIRQKTESHLANRRLAFFL